MEGPCTFLGRDVEDRLASWLTKMARIGYGQTRDTLFDKVQDIVARLKIPTPFTNGRPSKQWYYLFMKRHPYLGIRQAQLLSRERAGIRHKGIEDWFQEFKDYLIETGNWDILDQLQHIFNCDETGFPIAPKPVKIIAEKGTPNVYACGSSSKQTITVWLCACTAEYYVKQMVVYPGVNFKHKFINKFFEVLRDVKFSWSHNGWMDQELFLQRLRNVFEPMISRLGLRQPVLLVIDGAKVHLLIYASEFCDEQVLPRIQSQLHQLRNHSWAHQLQNHSWAHQLQNHSRAHQQCNKSWEHQWKVQHQEWLCLVVNNLNLNQWKILQPKWSQPQWQRRFSMMY